MERLIKDGGHHLEWRESASRGGLDVKNCDLLLVDGASLWRDEAQVLRTCLVMRAQSGGAAAVCVDPALDPRAKISTPARLPYQDACGVRRTAAGHCVMRCLFQEQALQEYRTRDFDERSRPVSRVMVFEYQGEAGEGP